jgi:hypothetical protein
MTGWDIRGLVLIDQGDQLRVQRQVAVLAELADRDVQPRPGADQGHVPCGQAGVLADRSPVRSSISTVTQPGARSLSGTVLRLPLSDHLRQLVTPHSGWSQEYLVTTARPRPHPWALAKVIAGRCRVPSSDLPRWLITVLGWPGAFGEWFTCRTPLDSRVMTPVITTAMVLTVDELVWPGDLEAGDVIALPDEARRFLVSAVRLGQGGFILVVAPADGSQSGAERHVTLTTAMWVRRFGHVRVF